MKQTESEFYDRLNDIDKSEDGMNDGFAIIAFGVAAISGSVVGFIIGYLLGRFGG